MKPKGPAIRRLKAERRPRYKASERLAKAQQAQLLEDAQLPAVAPRPADADLFGEPTGFADGKRRALTRVAKRNLAAARRELEAELPPMLVLYYAAREALESKDPAERRRGLELMVELLPYTAAKRVAVATADVGPVAGGAADALRAYLAGMGGIGYVQGAAAGGGEGDTPSTADLVDGA